jgi:hypothetical protein
MQCLLKIVLHLAKAADMKIVLRRRVVRIAVVAPLAKMTKLSQAPQLLVAR